MHLVEAERVNQVEIEQRQIGDVVDDLAIVRAAEARMVRGDDLEIERQCFEAWLIAGEALRAVQEQQRLALPGALHVEPAAPEIDETVTHVIYLRYACASLVRFLM